MTAVAIEFAYVDKFRVRGRDVYTGPCPVDCEWRTLDSFNKAIEDTGIEIDGEVYAEIRGLETYAVFAPLTKGDPIGVMI